MKTAYAGRRPSSSIGHSMHEDFDVGDLPPLRDVDFATLASASSEEPFIREGFELLKDSIVVVTFVLKIRGVDEATDLAQDHAIIAGHYVRSIKLMTSLIRQVIDGHGGDQQMSISREFLDSLATIAYLLGDSGEGSRFESYVMDSLVAEREFLKDVRREIIERGGDVLPIEMRIQSSIDETLKSAGMQEDEIPSRKRSGWPSVQSRLALLGPTAYEAYRMGSAATHGTFSHLIKNHLEDFEGGYGLELRSAPFRPQPFFAMALFSLVTLNDYSSKFLGSPLPDSIARRREHLVQTLYRVDELHERWLSRGRHEP